MRDCYGGCPEHTCLSCCNDRRVQLEQQVEALKGLLRVARCPDTYCNGFGTCADGDPADPANVEIWQCQWCDERTKATAQQGVEE